MARSTHFQPDLACTVKHCVKHENLTTDKRIQVIHCLVEGCSIRGTCRMTGVAKVSVLKLLVDLGSLCSDHQDKHLRNVPCKRVEAGHGDAWTWTALCADTKLMLTWLVGKRDCECATAFVADLAARLAGRIQLTSDGHDPYLEAVEQAWGGKVDYTRVVKQYSGSRYAGCVITVVSGKPDASQISTSFMERANLTMRMGMRRFIVRMVRPIVGSPALADEVAQETWLRVLRGLDAFAGRFILQHWIFRIAANLAISLRRRDRRQIPFSALARSEPNERIRRSPWTASTSETAGASASPQGPARSRAKFAG